MTTIAICQVWARYKSWVWNSTQVSHTGGRCPGTLAIFHWYPSCITRELDWKQGSWDLNWHSNMERGQAKWWLNLLSHSTCFLFSLRETGKLLKVLKPKKLRIPHFKVYYNVPLDPFYCYSWTNYISDLVPDERSPKVSF